MAKVETPVAPRLVTAVDIAKHRLAARQSDPLADGLHRQWDWWRAFFAASSELRRGEWVLPGETSQIVASASHTLAGTALTDAPSGVPMSGGAEPAGAAKPHE